MRQAGFRLEPLGETIFEGFMDGRKWNGWALPAFPKPEAERLVRLWNEAGYLADYDQDEDVFRFAAFDQMGDPNPDLADEEIAEHFSAIIIDANKLYPIGAGAWVWEEVSS